LKNKLFFSIKILKAFDIKPSTGLKKRFAKEIEAIIMDN
jgi:hypothetical protein